MNLKQCSGIKARVRPTSPNQLCRLLRLNRNPPRFRPIPAPRTPFFPLLLLPSTVPALDSHNVTNHPRPSQELCHPPRDLFHQWTPTRKQSTFQQLPRPIRESQPILHILPMGLVTMYFGPDGRGISPRQASSATCKPYS
jgi:hypothetical protein